ncbi:MAG: endonuclease, partial [Oscillospiraceae bacterium]|nr:endonuclease [Oscillospiraceae bacterium]
MLTAKHTTHTGYQATRPMYCYTDCVNSNISYISSFYSSTQVTGSWDSGATWNREHVWPHSKDADTNTNTDSNDSQDIVMLRPTAVSENSSRSNTAYGESSGYFDPNTVSTAVNVRGDCARILLFIYTEYGTSSNDIWSNMWGTSGVIESKDVLLKWMREDPVDTWEMGRNDVVQDITGVRNVFVDYPELAFQLFGESVPANYSTPSGGSAASSYTVTATSNNNAWGTVSVSGTTITASPAGGYYAAGFTVTSGTAAVTQNGNVFTVNPTSDCTVQINFAAREQVTLTYVANGSVYSTATVYAGDTVTLPTAATVVDGWTLSGWSASAIAETTAKPEYYALGASFVPTANATLYAVYTKSEAGSGEGGDYVLIDSTENLVLGQYLIVYTTGAVAFNGGLDILDASGNFISVTISDDKIASTAATDAAAFTIDPDAGTIQSASGYYIGATSNTSNTLLSSQTTVYTNVIDFTGGNADITSQGGAILRYNTGGRFRYYKSSTYTSQQAIQLYLKSGGETVTYTTAPTGSEHSHTLTHVAALAPTCGADGNAEYWYCAGCGKYFSDAAAATEIIADDTVIPATGNHTYGDWAANNDGTHTHVCSVCGAAETVNCTYTDVVTPPTPTELGYTTHTCTVCGYSFVDSYTSETGVDYTLTFTVPTGVTAVAPMTVNSVVGATLPTAEAPDGYTFLGWVTEDYDNVETRPETILTGLYKPTADITLKALYAYGEGSTLEMLDVDESPEELDELVIVESGGVYAMYQETSGTSYVKNFTFTNDAATIAADEKNTWTVHYTDDNTLYLGDAENGWLYTSGSNNLAASKTNQGEWALEREEGYFKLNSVSTNRYLSCRTDLTGSNQYLWRMGGKNGTAGTTTLLIYRLTVGASFYTTIIHAAHVHTPAAPVIENEVPATCTEAGSYDSVVYCSECGEELSRETVGIPALGHNWSAWTSNNDGTHSRTCSVC